MGPGDIAGALVDAARDPAEWCLRAASGLELALGAVSEAAAVEDRVPGIDAACRRQRLALRAGIRVGALVVAEVLSGEGPIFTLGPVENGDVRCYLLLLNQPVQHRGRSVGGIGGEALRLETEALFGTLDHRARGAYLGLTNSPRCFDIHDHPALQVDQVIVGIREERRPFLHDTFEHMPKVSRSRKRSLRARENAE